MLSAIKNRFILLLQLFLVMIYIIFEELIWEGIAKPIYETIHALKILQKLEDSPFSNKDFQRPDKDKEDPD